jgi:WD40 repeat protein
MDDALAHLLEQFDDRVRSRRGRAERVTESRELEPEARRELAEAIRCLRIIERVRRTSALAGELPRPAPQPGQAPDNCRQIGRFEILREIGSGGHGMVFLAWDPAAQRRVAIKTPHPEVLFTPQLRERFLREGIAAARLTHPNIVSVLEVDRSGPLCYIVSAFIDGQSLSCLLAQLRAPLGVRLVAQWVAGLADAVDHAHSQGVLHRDLKPANVVLEPRTITPHEGYTRATDETAQATAIASPGELTPKLTDFGLAKLIDVEDGRTRTGVMLGTPAYMAPEQVDSSLGPVDRSADVYGLGVILYECLTGRAPYESPNQADLLRRIAASDLTPPHRLRLDVPRDLEAICLRAMARKPTDRYASAAELAADLRRFLAGDATVARPMGVVERSFRWARRHPSAAAAACVAVVAALALASGGLWHFAQIEAALAVAEDARIRAEQGERKLRQLVYLRDMQEAHQALEAQDVLKASAVLARYGDENPGAPRGFLWRHLQARASGTPLKVQAHRGHAHTVEFSPDGSSIATAGADGFVRIWDTAPATLRASFRMEAAESNAARFSPDGRLLAVADSEGRVRVVDAKTQVPRSELPVEGLVNINCLRWHQDSRRLVAAGNPGTLALEWDVVTQVSRAIALEHTQEVNALAISPDGTLLASGSSDGAVYIRQLAKPEVAATRLEPNQSHITCLDFSPDGQFLASAGVHHSVRIWTTAGWLPAASLAGHTNRIGAVAFAPCEPVLAICDAAGVIREWNWNDDRVETVVDSGQGRIMSAAYSPEGRGFAACASNGALILWNRQPQFAATGTLPRLNYYYGCFTRDSRYLVTSDGGPNTAGFDTLTGTFHSDQENVADIGGVMEILPVGRSDIGMLWQLKSQASYRHGPVLGPAKSVALSNHFAVGSFAATPDGQLLISAQRNAADHVRFWDAATGREVGKTTGSREMVHSLCASSTGELLAIGGSAGARIWDLKRRQFTHRFSAHAGSVEVVAFSPDDRLLATGGMDGRVFLWKTQTGTRLPMTLSHTAPLCCISFCLDEPVLVTGDEAGNVRIWSLDNGEELIQLAKFPSAVRILKFSPDGQWLVASYLHQSFQELRYWRAPLRQTQSRLIGSAGSAEFQATKSTRVKSGG